MQNTLVMSLVNTSPPMGKLRTREHSQESGPLPWNPVTIFFLVTLVHMLLGLPCKHSDI